MKALTWHGKGDMRCESVPDPTIQDSRDAIIRVTGCAICGSDLHIYDGVIPTMERGDVLGHETMGEVVEVGRGVSKLRAGDRVVVPFTIACANASSASAATTPDVNGQIPMRTRRQSFGDILPPASSATRIFWADSLAAKQSICASHTRTLGRSKFPTG